MKRLTAILPALIISATAWCAEAFSTASLIPAPAFIDITSADTATVFTLPKTPAVYLAAMPDADDSRRLAEALRQAFPGYKKAATAAKANITLGLIAATGDAPRTGAYAIDVDKSGAKLTATTPEGLFYAIGTLSTLLDDNGGSLPALAINDFPRFGYRGMMLDVSRHFRDKDFVKKQIDAMARLKLNNLHLHLTDAAGWRIEIDRYPRLTELAAWRPGKTWKEWNERGNKYVEQGDTAANGGYFTKDDIREIVAYAADRYINVIPEIEMPSHSEEVLTAYPELSCTHEPYKQSDFCPGNEATFEFLENVLTEVIDLFPSNLIHIGGDEAPKQSWPDCPLCQKRMADEGIADVDGLQSYLIHRIEKFLNSKGRSLLGWDEIMEGGLAPNAAVMSWRGTEGGERAAAAGHRVIMTPGRYCYLDGYQDAPPTQPEAIGGFLPLELVYSYEPLPASIAGTPNEHYLYGLQGNLFAEYVPTAEHTEYMLYPRMYAIAERGWSRADRRDYSDFRTRALKVADEMRSEGYTVFDLNTEVGNRKEAREPDHHLAYGKPVSYARRPWKNYPANGERTLTDGIHGGWAYSDQRWQAFVGNGTERMDVTIDLGEMTPIGYIGADFMQICGPGVFMPAKVVIEVSDNGEEFRTLATIDNKVERDTQVSFKNFAWTGSDTARYVRYIAEADEHWGGVLFIDEIVVR